MLLQNNINNSQIKKDLQIYCSWRRFLRYMSNTRDYSKSFPFLLSTQTNTPGAQACEPTVVKGIKPDHVI